MCGASLVSEKWLVTAAHCVHNNKRADRRCTKPKVTAVECKLHCPSGCHRVLPSELKVYLGLTDLTTKREAGYSVKNIVIHPGWDLSARDNAILKGHDIALLQLTEAVQLSNKVWPVCLPGPELVKHIQDVGAELNVVGFGITNTTTKSQADIMQRAEVKIVGPDKCKSSIVWDMTGDQLCAKGDGRQKAQHCYQDSCQGDSGGGLISSFFGRKYLVGVVSFGESDCGGPSHPRPGVYTNMSSHVQWARDVIKKVDSWDQNGNQGGWGEWGSWSSCSAPCGQSRRFKRRSCSSLTLPEEEVHLGKRSQPVLGHLVGFSCQGPQIQVQPCYVEECLTSRPPGLIEGIFSNITSGISSGISGISSGISNITSGIFNEILPTVPSPITSEKISGGECTYDCSNWPYQQCQVQLSRDDGSWQRASCLNPYQYDILTGNSIKFINYPRCGNIPPGCIGCDDFCAVKDGMDGKEDYF